jgi:sugar lactone lactonase YvrE
VCDERRQRLYFVDCQASTLHWLDDDDATLQTFWLPSMPTGIVPTDEGLLVGALDDGLHVIDPDGATTRLVASYRPSWVAGATTPALTSPATSSPAS